MTARDYLRKLPPPVAVTEKEANEIALAMMIRTGAVESAIGETSRVRNERAWQVLVAGKYADASMKAYEITVCADRGLVTCVKLIELAQPKEQA